jgi:hypothetical protein
MSLRTYPLATLVALSAGVAILPACSSSPTSSSAPPNEDAGGSLDASRSDAPNTDGAEGDASSPDTSDGAACSAAQFQWATSGGGPGQYDAVNGVAVDKDGNAWLTGTFIGSATWGSFTLSSVDASHTTAFVAKLDPAGHVLLARAIEGGTGGIANTSEVGARIRVDANGDAYVVGRYEQQLDVDDVHLVESNTGNGSAFLLKLDHATGRAVWGTTSSNGGDGEAATDLALDASGNVYVVGQYNGAVTFGSFALSGISSDKAIFVAKYSPVAND